MSIRAHPREPLSPDVVRHVAALARLRLGADECARIGVELAQVLDYFDLLASLDVEGVEPLAHPHDGVNRLDADEPVAPLPTSRVLVNAPATEGPFIAVPKVIDSEGANS